MSTSLVATLKRAVAALEADRIPYLLGGGMGCWAYGGPPSSKDLDLMVKTEDEIGRASCRERVYHPV